MQCNPISWAIAAYRSLPLINVSDTWLCFFPSIILTVKQNDCVKDTKSFVRILFQAIRLWLVKIKIVTVGYPCPPPKKKKKKTKKKKIQQRQWTWKKNPYKLKKSAPPPPPTPSITSVTVEYGIQTFRFRTIWVRSIHSVFSLTN